MKEQYNIKTVLILMTIMQANIFVGKLISVFVPSETQVIRFVLKFKELKKQVDELVETKGIGETIVVAIIFAHMLFLCLYYILASMYVNTTIFILLSCLLILQSWEQFWTLVYWAVTDDADVLSPSLVDRLIALISLMYIGFLIYHLII